MSDPVETLPVDDDGDWDPTRGYLGAAMAPPEDHRLAEAQAALERGDAAEAERLLAAVLVAGGDHPGAWHGLGLAAFAQGDAFAAVERMERSVALDGAVPEWHHNLALARLRAGLPLAAEASLRTALRLDPQRAASLDALGRLLLDAGRPAEAIDPLERAAELAGSVGLPLLAEACVRAGLIERAFRAADHALARFPDDPAARRTKAGLLAAVGAAAEGLALLDHPACRAQPGDDLHRGALLLDAGRLGEALATATGVLAVEPAAADALALRARALDRAGHAVAAAADARRALVVGLDRPDLHAGFGKLALRHGWGEPALAHLHAAFALSGGAEPFAAALVDALTVLGRLDDAALLCRRWHADRPDHPWPAHLGAALTGTGVPARTPDAVVRWRYDRLDEPVADRPTPEAVVELARLAARHARHALDRPLRVLDLGCGRGVVGTAVRPEAGHLTGVDLASRFAEWSRRTGVYDTALVAEAAGYAAARPGRFDLVTAEGLLPFVGDAGPLLRGMARSLAPGGFLFLTGDRLTEEPWRLLPDGGYAHAADDIRSALEALGLAVVGEDEVTAGDRTVFVLLAHTGRL